MNYEHDKFMTSDYGEIKQLQESHTATGTEASVCRDIADRQRKGIAKYGTTVAGNPLSLRQWLQHAYEEALDGVIYIRRAMDEMDATPPTRCAPLTID